MKTSGLRAVCLAALLWCCFSPIRAQVIPIKTVPIAQGDQFQLFPSQHLGMGSASIALADSVHDPFVNPATGARLRGARFFSSPTVYSLSQGTGGGRSLPLAAMGRIADWFGGIALALQQVDPSRPPNQRGVVFLSPPPAPPPPPSGDPLPPDESSFVPVPDPDRDAHANRYLFAMFGRAWPERRASVGASVFWNGLHALDGVDLLYAGSRRVAQAGHTLDLRLGALKEWGEAGERSLQGILVHHRFSATHDVTYADLFWDPGTAQFRERGRMEHYADQTNVWGLQLKYEIPIGAAGWRLGWLATANRASHPKIPEYDLQNVPAIPRDPGYSSAYNVGVGVAKRRGAATFGMDVVYEPIRSYTWADATSPVATVAGDTIAAGAKTIENRFRFSNALLRFGTAQEFIRSVGTTGELQLGLILRVISYDLAQQDHVQGAERDLKTSWTEWTPTWGLSLRFSDLEVRYHGRVTHGAGRPADALFGGVGVRDMAVAGGSIIAAPTGPFLLTGVSSTTHQISLSVPLR